MVHTILRYIVNVGRARVYGVKEPQCQWTPYYSKRFVSTYVDRYKGGWGDLEEISLSVLCYCSTLNYQ